MAGSRRSSPAHGVPYASPPGYLGQLSIPFAILLTVALSFSFVFSSIPTLTAAPAAATASVQASPATAPPDHTARFSLQRAGVGFQRRGGEQAGARGGVGRDERAGQESMSLLSTLQGYGGHHGYNHTFHSALLNQPAVSLPDDEWFSPSHPIRTSNRAIAHAFPTPLPHLLPILSRQLTAAIFASSPARLQRLLDTVGRYLPAQHVLYVAMDSAEMRAVVDRGGLSNVYVLPPSAGVGAGVGHSADHHVLRALELLADVRPDSSWYYLCDDDTFPVIPRLASYLHSFYRHTMFTAADKVFMGDSTATINGRVLPLAATGQPLDMMLTYHPSEGGLLLNNALLADLRPHLSSCPLLSAWSMTLAKCIDHHVPDHHLIDVPLGYRLHAQSMDALTASGAEDDAPSALSYAAMDSAFAEFGAGGSEEAYWREMELRSYTTYIQLAEEMVSQLKADVEAARHAQEVKDGRRKHRLASLAPSISAPAGTVASPLRVLLINTRHGDSHARHSNLASLVYSMMRQVDFAPLALLTQLDWEISYAVVTGSPADGCRRCDLYHKAECEDMYIRSSATLIPHLQHQTTEANVVLEVRAVQLHELDYGSYDIILSLDAVLPPHITQRNPRPFFAHYLHSSCDIDNNMPLSLPAPGYHLYLHSHLSQLDALEAGKHVIHFPSTLLYHGIFQSLLDVPTALLSNRTLLTALVGVEEANELSGAQLQQLSSAVSQMGLSDWRTITPVIQPQSDLSILSQSRVCLFLPSLFTASLKSDVNQQRAVTSHLLHAMAAGCLVIASAEAADYSVAGQYDGRDEDDAMRLLLSPQTIAADETALLDILSMAADRSWVEREVAYQRSALNGHMLEKPLHALLDAYTQHKLRRWR